MSRKRHPYMPFYGDDWRGGTEDIPAEFRGPYLDLIWVIFDQGGRIPNIEAALTRHARLGTRKFRRFWDEHGSKFLVDGDQIGHRKVDQILSSLAKVSAKLSENGRKGGRKTQQKQRGHSSPAKANQTKGLVSPFQGEKPNRTKGQNMEETKPAVSDAANAPAFGLEGPRGLFASDGRLRTLRDRIGDEGYDLWWKIRDCATRANSVTIADSQEMSRHLLAFTDGVLVVADLDPTEGRFKGLVDEAEANGTRISSRQPAQLTSIDGGKQ